MQDNQSRWVNNFWGNNDAGYHQLMQRMHDARQTCDELKHYYRERMAIEHEYSRKLQSLSRKALGSNETGDIRASLETVRTTTKSAAVTHDTVARQLNEQILGPLNAFSTSMKGRSKTIEDTMAQLTRAKNSQNTNSEKARSKYVNECNRISGYQASQNLLMGKELDKNNQKLDKASYQVEGFQRQYQDSLKALTQSMEAWNAEWRVSCDKLEQLEEERLSFLKSNLWAYANAVSAACVADDEACESVRLSLERCDPASDLAQFSRERGTGSRIQDPPEFVNFLQGFSRESGDGDGHYHVANFSSSLNTNAIPDLGVPSPSSSSQASPMSSQSQFTPSSSPEMQSNSYMLEKQHNQTFMQQQNPSLKDQLVKKRKSWAMPFKRKQSSDQFVSALDDPIASVNTSSQASLHSAAPSQFQMPSEVKAANRKSWAPSSTAEPAYAPTSSANSASNEDPLLTALERLKTPGLKQRPKSAAAAPASNNTSPYTPYGNGSPSKFGSHFHTQSNASEMSSGRKSPVRKQVGSASRLPQVTSDGRRVIKHCRAQFDYRAAIPEEVTFRKGDLLLVTEMQEDGWWDCEVTNPATHENAFGLAPSNFLADV